MPTSPTFELTAAVPTAPPDFLTLDEAAAVLRVGRSTAYREANAFERSGGRTGIPVIRYGKQFRVPRYRLEDQLGGPVTWWRSSPEAIAMTTPRTTRLIHDRQVPAGCGVLSCCG